MTARPMLRDVTNVELVRMVFGSHLYGTDTPESDRDYKGVYAPTLRHLLLGRSPKSIKLDKKPSSRLEVKVGPLCQLSEVGDPYEQCGCHVHAGQVLPGPDSKVAYPRPPYHEGCDCTVGERRNTAEDVDCELYSLQYFVEMLVAGDTHAVDMVHAPESAWLFWPHACWLDLVANRRRAYSRNLKALVGYARRQAAKYGVKGSRLAEARRVLEVLQGRYAAWNALKTHAAAGPAEPRLQDLWSQLPNDLEHGGKIEAGSEASPDGEAYFRICGKMLQGRARLSTVIPPLDAYVRQYGKRAELAERNEGVDWKAISHAFRASFEVEAILRNPEAGFEYPLPEAGWLLRVKAGDFHYLDDGIGAQLDERLEMLEELAATSDLPDHPDRRWWEDWLAGWLYRLRVDDPREQEEKG